MADVTQSSPPTTPFAGRSTTRTRQDPSLTHPEVLSVRWSDVDVRAVDTARLLAADAVQRVGNGHPGTAMSLAPLAYLLFQQVLVHDPSDDEWLGRDRFVLSAGHTSLTLYIQLYFCGYGEHLAALRAIPGLDVVRPGDANETSICWRTVIEHTNRPAGLILSRQNLPILHRGTDGYASAEGAARGGYVLAEADDELQVILIGTGSEVQIALDARTQLQAAGIGTRVVSMPCVEWFAAEEPSYRNQVLPPSVAARVSIEAGVAAGWERIVGDAGRSISIEHFGASADAATLYRELGLTIEATISAAYGSLHDARDSTQPGGHPAGFAPNSGGTADKGMIAHRN